VFRTEARTCKHCQPAGRADAVPAIAPVAIVIATAATATSLSTTRTLRLLARVRQEPGLRGDGRQDASFRQEPGRSAPSEGSIAVSPSAPSGSGSVGETPADLKACSPLGSRTYSPLERGMRARVHSKRCPRRSDPISDHSSASSSRGMRRYWGGLNPGRSWRQENKRASQKRRQRSPTFSTSWIPARRTPAARRRTDRTFVRREFRKAGPAVKLRRLKLLASGAPRLRGLL
jgi:hypothetical protein